MHHRPCVVYVLEPLEFAPGKGAHALVRRIEVSPSFDQQFGRPSDERIDNDHALSTILPVGKKMTWPTPLRYRDKNGVNHECLGEAFKTKYNVFLLIYQGVLGTRDARPRHAKRAMSRETGR